MNKKRLIITNKLRFYVFLIILLVMLTSASTGFLSIRSAAEPITIQYENYLVKGGDTLWEIALSYKPIEMDTRDYIYDIKDSNNLKSDTIKKGQVIKVPLYN